MSMFSFQAIHNLDVIYVFIRWLFIDYVNVLFSSNSQHLVMKIESGQCCLSIMSMFSFQAIHNEPPPQTSSPDVVYRLCQCSLFKQFTTDDGDSLEVRALFIDYVNVLFSSNSQLSNIARKTEKSCLSIMSMFSFQAIHNPKEENPATVAVVYRLCQCSLFKQFTTVIELQLQQESLFIDYVNVLFSSNSQHY